MLLSLLNQQKSLDSIRKVLLLYSYIFSKVNGKNNHYFLMFYHFWTSVSAGRILLNSVRPSILLSVCKFSQNWFFSFFSETQHGVMRPCAVVCVWERAIFWGKIALWIKLTKTGQIMSKNGVFRLFWKIVSLYLAKIYAAMVP